MTRLRRAGGSLITALFVPAVLVLLWWGGVAVFDPAASLVPSPSRVFETGSDLLTTADLWRHVAASVRRLLLGALAGVSSGLLFGVIAGLRPRIGDIVTPLATFFSTIGGLVWIPLAFAWFGTGLLMSTFLIWTAVFFVVFFNVMQGIRQVAPQYPAAVYTLGGNRLDAIRRAILPAALPSTITGVRVGMGFAWRALIAAEILGTPVGLGQMVWSAATFHRTDIVIFGALLIGVLGTLMDRVLLEELERRTVVRWGTVATGR